MTDTMNVLLLLANGAITGVSCIRLLCYRRLGARFCRGKSLLAYALILATGTVSLRCFCGLYHGHVDLGEFALNCVLALAIFRVRGNVAGLFRPMRETGYEI